jgi:hypothetical protein
MVEAELVTEFVDEHRPEGADACRAFVAHL